MNEHLLRQKVQETDTFKRFEKFKQGIYLSKSKLTILLDYYRRATSILGIDSLKQNQSILIHDVEIIEQILKAS